MKRAVSREQMERFANVLKQTRAGNALSSALYKTLHTRFQAEDAGNTAWTINLNSLQWHHRVQGTWAPGTPPEEVQMDEGTLLALNVLVDLVERTTPTEVPAAKVSISPAQMKRFAQSLKAAQAGDHLSPELFRALHTRFRATDDDGHSWTIAMTRLRWHRRDHGKWVAADPPEVLYLDANLHEALIALPESQAKPKRPAAPPSDGTPSRERPATPETKTPPTSCPSCGNAIKPGKKFCTACGTRVG